MLFSHESRIISGSRVFLLPLLVDFPVQIGASPHDGGKGTVLILVQPGLTPPWCDERACFTAQNRESKACSE
jgi:hypothetical protein